MFLEVVPGHGASPSGRAVWLCFCAVAVAAAAAAANFVQVFCFVCKFSVLFLGFRRDVREFLGGILGLQGHGVSPSGRAVWLCLCAVAAAAANFLQVFCSVSRVSDVTLESFWVGFSDSFVLQGHGVLLFRNRPLGLRCGAVLRAWELAAAVNIGWIGSDSISSRIAG